MLDSLLGSPFATGRSSDPTRGPYGQLRAMQASNLNRSGLLQASQGQALFGLNNPYYNLNHRFKNASDSLRRDAYKHRDDQLYNELDKLMEVSKGRPLEVEVMGLFMKYHHKKSDYQIVKAYIDTLPIQKSNMGAIEHTISLSK